MTTYPLPTVVAVARTLSPYYRKLYAGLPDTGWALADLPVVEQAAFWDPAVPIEAQLTGPLSDGIVFKSGGTTGSPKFSVFTAEEWTAFVSAFGESLTANGLHSGMRVANLFYAGELYASFLFLHDSLRQALSNVVEFPISGQADLAFIAKSLKDFSIDVVLGVPTTILKLAELVRETGMTGLKVQRILYGGEDLYDDQRAFIASVFPGAHITSVGIASVDGALIGYCDPTCGPHEHRVFGRHTIVEIVDDATGLPIEAPGQEGRVLLTNLTRLLMPIIRYPSGDRARWIDPPGTEDRRFRLLGRSDDGARIGPMTLYVEDVHHVLEPYTERAGISGFQLVVTHQGRLDRMTLRIGTGDPAAAAAHTAQISAAIYAARPMFGELLHKDLVHPLEVEWVSGRELETNPRTGKLRRVIDRRQDGA
ncbi:phenylacetate--CoA ligase family protein [Azorhizobium doebereinerae]|uniref:phenylacetate--CoA ligase family protein n=1 Tax=Azorhizobium doebereinerae TaxID=281091 RepID=UPI0004054B09|nr:AMP-binding protein [Azorhizobium doebereinerae]